MTDSSNVVLPDLLPIERAARIVLPIADMLESRGFDAGVFHILGMLGQFDIVVQADAKPPSPAFRPAQEPLTRKWFAAFQQLRGDVDMTDWHPSFLDWCRGHLKVSRTGILANLTHPAGQLHEPIENVDAAGGSWSFAQVLAWIATKNLTEVARVQYAEHFGPPMVIGEGSQTLRSDGEIHAVDSSAVARAMMQSDHGRRKLIGWLVLQTSLNHCKCGSEATIDRENWETCQCVGRAYDELRAIAKGMAHPIPEYRPKPAHASFTLTWFDGAQNLRFTRAEVVDRWPQQNSSASLRSPAVKEGRPPSEADILAKADEMKSAGKHGYTIAKEMRHQKGFEHVATTEVRELIKGRWKPGGRPPKKGA